ncbi:hypothetical protein QBC37DRAFT_465032 [Rhypophila decipiens]|uniref:Uncharacterized protein n=1 Tax=Rhypophila decipiens TaxID=261697 RepID=A0AAN6YA07_9PEZI|nr:hypothetical protein QBC37DRAFT_465032 [Rhypophila decipiens]
MDRKTGQDKEPKVFESLQNDPSWREIEETGLINDPRNAVEWEKPCEILPIEEMEIRLEYIRKLEQRLHERQIALQTAYQKWGSRGKPVRIYPFDAATIAGLLVVDLTTLEDSLHGFWGKACFALKCLGIIEAGEPVTEGLTTKDPTNEENQDDTTVHLKLQFHWMPKRINKALLKPEERTKEAILGQFDGYWGNPRDPAPRVAFYRSNGRLLRSGDIIRVAVKRRHCQKMKLAFDVQWALTNICALAGGGRRL